MAEFNLADVLAQSVSKLDTGRENIEYIPREKIHADPGNFYSMDGIDQLAANIELCGLMDPIRIRADGDGYKIVSGHRRFAAMTILADAGNETYQQIPCIIDTSQVSEAMQELRLIYANSDTRKLSSADLNKQVERVTELLYKLKEEGVEFPGRMRDHVAEACKLSKSKIARLNAIKNGLCNEIMPMYEKNELTESSAYKLATMSQEDQQLILTAIKMSKKDSTARLVNALADWLEKVKSISCKKSPGGTCSNCLQKMIHRANVQYSWNATCDYRCCANCDKLATCKDVCALVADKQLKAQAKRKKELAEEKERNKTEKEARAAREKSAMERLTAIYTHVGNQIKKVGADRNTIARLATSSYYDVISVDRYLKCDFGTLAPHCSVLGTGLSFVELDRLVAVADAIGLSLDELLMHTPVKVTPAEAPAPAALSWQTAALHEHGAYVVEVELTEDYTKFLLVYKQPYHENLSMSRTTYRPIELPVLRWFKLPDFEE